MNRAVGKQRSAHRHTKPLRMPTESKVKVNKQTMTLIVIAVLVAIPLGLGKYIEFNSPGPFDSGGNVYSAYHIVKGATFGVQEKPAAEVGTLLINMLGVWIFGFNEIGPKILQMVLQATALIMMFVTMRKLFGNLGAAVGVFIASTYLSAPLIAKFGNVKEQYMIASMVIGICFLVLRQLDGPWWYILLAGAFLGWAPLFKQTGLSAVGASGLFVLVQPIFKHRTWKQTGSDILLLLLGACISVTPVCIWLASVHADFAYWPYAKVWRIIFPGDSKRVSTYISSAREISTFSEQWPRVLRYYGFLILPISLACGSIIVRLYKGVSQRLSKQLHNERSPKDRFVLLFGVWWILDMAFVWISPRSYEQYYLPLNASAAMLSGYILACYYDHLKMAAFKTKWVVTGTVVSILMMVMIWPIFFGISSSPHSGAKYPTRQRGYAQRLQEISQRHRTGSLFPWERVGQFIQENSNPSEGLYVWGWYPGIYVKAQRFSPTSHAFMSEMHTRTHEELTNIINELVEEMKKAPPKFIVDTHKQHFPWNRPPLELWPIIPSKGPIPADPKSIASYDKQWTELLRTHPQFKDFGEDEVQRYEILRPLREFVMTHYVPVKSFGTHVIFQRKNP